LVGLVSEEESGEGIFDERDRIRKGCTTHSVLFHEKENRRIVSQVCVSLVLDSLAGKGAGALMGGGVLLPTCITEGTVASATLFGSLRFLFFLLFVLFFFVLGFSLLLLVGFADVVVLIHEHFFIGVTSTV